MQHEIEYNCPNCGSLLKSSNLATCSYCNAKIDVNVDNWKLVGIKGDKFTSYDL